MEANNAKALREALVKLINAIYDYHENAVQYVGRDIRSVMAAQLNEARAALAAPPRNCDRLNVDDAFEAFTFMCDNTDCRDCPYKQNNKYGDRELCAMLFLYDNGNGGKEGGAK